jgi:hypothetical protein
MGSTRSRMAGVAAFTLLSAGLFAQPLLAQQGQWQAPREGVMNSKAEVSGVPMNNRVGERQGQTNKTEVQATAPPAAPSPAAPAPPSAGPAPSPSAPVPAPGPAVPAQPGVAAPPGLSADAPEVPPNLGVVGGGGRPGPSPASTPEPSTLLLMGTGVLGLYRLRKRQ